MRSRVWDLVVPLKPLPLAKSRLAGMAGDGLRPALALAFAQDTVAGALACPAVGTVLVVTDDPLAGAELSAMGARIVPDAPAAGLNAALAHGAAVLRRERPTGRLATLNADLPALRPQELAAVLEAAAGAPAGRAFLADAAGVGTTLLAAAPGIALAPAFGGASRARHRASGAWEIPLPGVESVRRDVDTGQDLLVALAMGVGRHTAAATAGLVAAGQVGEPPAPPAG